MAKLWLILGICLAIFGTFGEQVQALRNVRDIEHQSALGDLGFDQQRKDEEDHDYEEVMDDYELQDSFSNTSLVYFNASDYVNGSMPANVTRHHGFLHGFVESLSVILVSEIGDKTFFIAAIMAMTSNKLIVFLGAISALALMTVLSAVLGWVVTSFIPRKYTYYTCTVIMFLFGLKMLYEAWTMKPDEAQELQHEVEEELARRGSIASNSSRAREQTPEDEDQDPEGQELQEVRSEPGFDDDTEGDDASTAQSPKPKKRVQIQEKGLFGKKCYKIFKLFLNCFTMTFLAEWGGGIHPDIPQCCRDRERTRLALQSERDALRGALRTAESGLSAKDKEMSVKLDALHGKHQNSLAEMKSILLAQRQVGAQWKEEMTILTKRFEVKVKELQSENKELKMELERLREVFKVKEVEADEARELNGIYSAKLTKMERKFKKLKDEDEESYMEMTF